MKKSAKGGAKNGAKNGLDSLYSSSSEIDAYIRRLKQLREIVSGANQSVFANMLGMDFKRWNNFERGYPLPMKVAFMLNKEFGEKYGFSIDWLWWGKTKGLSEEFKRKLEKLDDFEREAAQLRRNREQLDEQIEAFEERKRQAIRSEQTASSKKRKSVSHPAER